MSRISRESTPTHSAPSLPEAQQDAKPVARHEHVCGLQGFGHSLDDECPACRQNGPASPTAPVPAGAEALQDAPATLTDEQNAEAVRNALAPLLNAFGELHWLSARRDVPHERISDAFEAVIACATRLSGVAAPAGASELSPLSEQGLRLVFATINERDATALKMYDEGVNVDPLEMIGARHAWRAFIKAVRAAEAAHGIGSPGETPSAAPDWHPCRDVDGATCADMDECSGGCVRITPPGVMAVDTPQPSEGSDA